MTLGAHILEVGQGFAYDALRAVQEALDVFEGRPVHDAPQTLNWTFTIFKYWRFDHTVLPRDEDEGGLLESYARPVYRTFDAALEAVRAELGPCAATKKEFLEAAQVLMQHEIDAKPLKEEVVAFVARTKQQYARTAKVTIEPVELKITREAFCAFLKRAIAELEPLQQK